MGQCTLQPCITAGPREGYRNSLEPRPYTPRFYLAALEKKSGRVRPGFEASLEIKCHVRIHGSEVASECH